MRFSVRPLLMLCLFAAVLVLLRQGILVATSGVPVLREQVEIMQRRDIDPAALFFTDSPVALQAIRQAELRNADYQATR